MKWKLRLLALLFLSLSLFFVHVYMSRKCMNILSIDSILLFYLKLEFTREDPTRSAVQRPYERFRVLSRQSSIT